jgi:purine-binding chemotaxis protein CheW
VTGGAPGRRGDAAARADAADAIVELCAFRVGDEEYVLDLRRIREILQPLPIVPVPRAPEYVDGVMNLRGEVIPVVDARKRLGLAPRAGGRSKVLVVNVAGRVLGLVVDGVAEVLRIPRSGIGPPPALLGEAEPRLFLGVCGAGPSRRRAPEAGRARARAAPQRLRLLLNVKALLEPATPAIAAAARQLAAAARSA